MNCRQYINAVNRRASDSNKHVSHGTPSSHSAGRKCSYVPLIRQWYRENGIVQVPGRSVLSEGRPKEGIFTLMVVNRNVLMNVRYPVFHARVFSFRYCA